jgi:hypothetical protein
MPHPLQKNKPAALPYLLLLLLIIAKDSVMYRELPVWRSLMYVPVNVEKYVDKAHTRGADVIQLDVEDSVPPAE